MKFSFSSIILNLMTIFFSVKINLSILHDYLASDGKTQALHSFLELKYIYKYYLLIISLLSLAFIIFAYRKKENKGITFTAILSLFIGIASVFLEIWKWFI